MPRRRPRRAFSLHVHGLQGCQHVRLLAAAHDGLQLLAVDGVDGLERIMKRRLAQPVAHLEERGGKGEATS